MVEEARQGGAAEAAGRAGAKGVTAVYTSGGVNRRPHCLAWSLATGRAYYGCHQGVMVYCPTAAAVLATLPGHTGLVTCLALVADPSGDGEDLVASGGADNRVLVWRVGPAGAGALLATLAIHSGPITALALLATSEGLTVASTATDSTICTSTVALEAPVALEGAVVEVAEWRQELGSGLALALHLVRLPGQEPLLVVARDNCRLLLIQVK
jgi:hypothetical protein